MMRMSRMADVTKEIFASASAMARASRSYCIGLQDSKHEVESVSNV